MQVRQMPDNEGGMLRQFIPARLEDNPSMAQDDPGYEGRLSGLGSETLVAAMRWGDWNVIDGAFFDCFATDRHIVRPFTIPENWLRFRAGDWGSAKPSSIGWWAVVSDPTQVENMAGQRFTLPRGCLVRYRELYTASKPNVGLKLTAEELAVRIKAAELGDKIGYGVLDPSAFSQNGGPSIAERMYTAKGSDGKPLNVMFRPADNTRVALRGAMSGWDAVRARLKGDEDGPMLVAFSTCKDFIRTLPVLQHDPNRAEDIDSSGEDHVADETRYACLSRPWIPRVIEKPKGKTMQTMTLNELWSASRPKERRI